MTSAVQEFKNILWHLPKAIVSSWWYGFPARRLTLIGVTGTKGKTTTVHLIFHLLKENGVKVGLISTIGAFFPGGAGSGFARRDEELDTGLHITSPDPRQLHGLLRRAVDKGLTHLVLEVTSSALDQYRVWGVHFDVSVVTHVTSDHLDYHGTMERYVASKMKLIRQSTCVVLNRECVYYPEFRQAAERLGKDIREFGSRQMAINDANRQAAMVVAGVLGIRQPDAEKALESFPGVPGRMDMVYQKGFTVIVDFAHTPESFSASLVELRQRVKGKGHLIAVFGCAGERDPARRKMGAVAAKLADFFVITAEDPRSEKVEEISQEIAKWARKAGAEELAIKRLSHQAINASTQQPIFIRVPDRQSAINLAISLAKVGDVIGLFGKGHEKSMCYGKTELPWSEYNAAKIALKLRDIKLKSQN